MMRKLFYVSTAAFWIAVAGFWIGNLLVPGTDTSATAAEREIGAAELARHAVPKDCWMAIRGNVYDITAYLPDHPSRPSIIEPWCGKEASEAYDTKTKGRKHSPEADALLPKYRIGRFVGGG
ncbi:cytochrome b5-like heme/steroid binding domain-containing protein [Rhodopseudomonas sp. BR0G17]|uniref:cytochrome b5 domain-containing protein n=1 Tax=Rhodopseudomonas sp. BR0G17 TaxID=2269368 RepID=UPI0013DF717D|nr:cytochrome b5-like heme/steroid binding domain-containing protein [Rhodopseudomonas sp. BR0G17]NEW97793.1 cytochrome b5 domain-containing protein [Rhodopseudomonas sp. BR0G17]